MGSCFLRIFAMLGALAASAFSQIGGGSVVGNVADSSGAAVSGAKVTAIQAETGARRETHSND